MEVSEGWRDKGGEERQTEVGETTAKSVREREGGRQINEMRPPSVFAARLSSDTLYFLMKREER